MFWKYPIAQWISPRKDGLYIVKHQGRVRHIGIAFKEETGKNIKQQLRYHFHNQSTEVTFMYDNKDLCSVRFLPMTNYEEAKKTREELYEKYNKYVKRYEK